MAAPVEKPYTGPRIDKVVFILTYISDLFSRSTTACYAKLKKEEILALALG